MATAAHKQTSKVEKYVPSKTTMILCLVLIAVGGITMGAGVSSHPSRVWPAYLTSFFYFTSLALGGLFFAAVQHVSKAGWSATIRRIPEAFTAFLPVALILGLILIVGGSHLYEWLHPEVVAKDKLLQHKSAYLNQTFFIIRTVVFFVLWLFFAKQIVGGSLKQDETGDDNLTHRILPWSIAFLLVFALSYSLFSVDTLMSLHPHWYSTIFGVYCFSGLFQSSLALTILYMVFMMRKGLVKGFIDENHLHDVGKLLFAFTVFYAYIAFSQFMLIWYANIPEETIFYLHRAHGGWMAVSMSLLVFKFIVPFFALLPRRAKRNPMYLAAVSVLILVMQYVDIFWLVYPNFNEGHLVFSFWEIGVFLGFLGAFLFVVQRFLAKHSIIPLKDPRIHEALHHHI